MSVPTRVVCAPHSGEHYHIYNRTNNREPLFRNDENRGFFLRLYHDRLRYLADTLSWNLLPNHFHFVIRVKPEASVRGQLLAQPPASLTSVELAFVLGEKTISELVVDAFKRLFQSYAQSFNKVFQRKGNLFYRPFKRVHLTPGLQLAKAIVYVNANAQRHGLVGDFSEWKWTSWHELLGSGLTLLDREAVLRCFGGREEMIRVHREMTGLEGDPAKKLSTF